MYLSIEIILNGVADSSQHHQLNCLKVPMCTSGLFTFQPELRSGFYTPLQDLAPQPRQISRTNFLAFKFMAIHRSYSYRADFKLWFYAK